MRFNLLKSLLITTAFSLSTLANAFTMNGLMYDGSITFGSGLKQDEPQAVWKTIVGLKPQAFVFLGNNLDMSSASYQTLPAAHRIKQAYLNLWNNDDFQYFGRATTQHDIATFATWGPLDYGLHDIEANLEIKAFSKEQFGTFFGLDVDEMGDSYETGVFHAEYMDMAGLRVQLILLDTESYRSKLQYNKADSDCPAGTPVPKKVSTTALLGETQWEWLTEELKEKAQVRIIASSIPVLTENTCGETWGNYPAERRKLLELIKSEQLNGVILISGGRQLGEISRLTDDVPYPLHEISSGGLNGRVTSPEKNPDNALRITPPVLSNNFGRLRFHRQKDAMPKVDLEIRDTDGKVLQSTQFELGTLYLPDTKTESEPE